LKTIKVIMNLKNVRKKGQRYRKNCLKEYSIFYFKIKNSKYLKIIE